MSEVPLQPSQGAHGREGSCVHRPVPTQGSSWGYLNVNSSETLSIFGDKCPQNGSNNDLMAPRTTLECPHEGPSVEPQRPRVFAVARHLQESAPPSDPTVGLCLGTYGDRRGVGVSYERGTPVGFPAPPVGKSGGGLLNAHYQSTREDSHERPFVGASYGRSWNH